MSTATLNSALYRKVKTHTKYDRYFTKTPCKSTFLGDYTTTGGMQQMVELSFKYKDFTKAISKKLKGRNLKETVANIYQFAYDHIQYQADGYDQQLRSPSCTWNVRLEGVDCKSYSLFVSTILTNLNIPHSFRKVKQPSSPSRWSHVYVQIPSGNETLIIDPTKRVNTEVNYTQKEDMEVTLPYHALHGSVESSMNLQEHLTQESIGKFNRYLKRLLNEGVPSETVLNIKNAVRFAVQSGDEPSIQVTQDSFIVNGRAFYLTQRAAGLNGFLNEIIVTPNGLHGILDEAQEAVGFFTDLFGPEDPASVRDRFSSTAVKPNIQQIEARIQQINASNILVNSTDTDRYLAWLIGFYWKSVDYFKSKNSKMAHRFVAEKLEEFQVTLRSRFSSKLKFRTKTEVISSARYGYKTARGYTKNDTSQTYRVYTSVKTSVKSIDLTPKDVHTVGNVNNTTPTIPTNTTTSNSTIPTDTTTTTTTTVDVPQSGSNATVGAPKKPKKEAGIGSGTLAVAALVLSGGFLLMNNNKKESNPNK
ncbi:hypothetical protein PG911_08825 [Tenacibaculum ovolyticum]|uniref:transglutaminase-like domain-containing protein n=1 Tax=Tenacibaculum ovolyticum TaxID=104270 RepID=UPI0022F3D6C7|nr:transglutaminase-like domain-containing protein [Tenacibaculum ovolyticum]WBX78349.1 hypothetical protein PG911_08825 [Tenacibaculum ovolyticum]